MGLAQRRFGDSHHLVFSTGDRNQAHEQLFMGFLFNRGKGERLVPITYGIFNNDGIGTKVEEVDRTNLRGLFTGRDACATGLLKRLYH